MSKRPFYGIDAPFTILSLAVGAVAEMIVLFIAYRYHFYKIVISVFQNIEPSGWLGEFVYWYVVLWLVLQPLFFFISASLMLHSSLRGKIKQRERIMKEVAWRGNEQVLDVGCGRGLWLIEAAKYLTSGKATGIDIWQHADLSFNSKQATLDNAHAEGVVDRVEVLDMDARLMSFPDNFFDVVVSNFVIHNIRQKLERDRALDHMLRVLKPEGTMILQDFRFVTEYEEFFRLKGVKFLYRSARQWSFFPPAFYLIIKK